MLRRTLSKLPLRFLLRHYGWCDEHQQLLLIITQRAMSKQATNDRRRPQQRRACSALILISLEYSSQHQGLAVRHSNVSFHAVGIN